MTKIQELPTNLANQIAAGEVIERPASVVKELVENALDANATQIEICVEQAGLELVSVTDNGEGIEEDDVKTAFLRHATSKIVTTKDLFRVATLGFRGEALASIAAIAEVTLQTAIEDGYGVSLTVEGGEFGELSHKPLRRGTTITVRNLFYNTPARLKYVKSVNTELAHITDIVNRLALAHPGVVFTLKNGDRVVFKTVGRDDMQQAIAGVYGVKGAKQMVAIEAEDADFRVKGFVSLPELTRASRQYISWFINGRYVRNYALTKALIAGYGSKLMIGRYPMAVVSIEMDPLLVDVNVHPTKQEVRLSKESALATLVQTAVQKQLAAQTLIPDALSNLPLHTQQAVVPTRSAEPAEETPAVEEENAPLTGDAGLSLDQLPSDSIFGDAERLLAWDKKYVEQETEQEPSDVTELVPLVEPKKRFPELRFLAQVHGSYLLAEADDGLYLIDQHAAQERINYEKNRERFGAVVADQQPLLVPLVLEYATADALRINELLPQLEEVGIHLESFGQNSFIVHEHPTWMIAGSEETTIREMVDWVLSLGRVSVGEYREQAAIMVSCKSAIKANHHLDTAQSIALLKGLSQTKNPFNCPHGRPTLVRFDNADLQRMFKRIQDSHDTSTEWQ